VVCEENTQEKRRGYPDNKGGETLKKTEGKGEANGQALQPGAFPHTNKKVKGQFSHDKVLSARDHHYTESPFGTYT